MFRPWAINIKNIKFFEVPLKDKKDNELNMHSHNEAFEERKKFKKLEKSLYYEFPLWIYMRHKQKKYFMGFKEQRKKIVLVLALSYMLYAVIKLNTKEGRWKSFFHSRISFILHANKT